MLHKNIIYIYVYEIYKLSNSNLPHVSVPNKIGGEKVCPSFLMKCLEF